MKKLTLLFCSIFISFTAFSTDYYIDFKSGNDANTGTSTSNAWKHAPGDPNATGNPDAATLLPGDRIIFKGGVVYEGNLSLIGSGTPTNHIEYLGNAWGSEKAIIDGSQALTGWTKLNDSTYYTNIPPEYTLGDNAGTMNLHEYDPVTQVDTFLWVAQEPEPFNRYFYDDHDDFYTVKNHNITRTSITDSTIFNQADPNYWENTSLLIWINPNLVTERKITSYSPTLHTVYFDALSTNAIYPDGRDQSFAIFNSIRAMDNPGEFHVNFNEGRIYLQPRYPLNIEQGITISVRDHGINIGSKNGITIDGFVVRKHSGESLRSGIGIGNYTASSTNKHDYVIKNCTITHNCHSSKGYGGIYLSDIDDAIVENNLIVDNPQHAAIYCTKANNLIVRNNTSIRSGGTSLRFYNTHDSRVINNAVLESKGSHSNGMTFYLGCKDVLIAGNKIIDCVTPLTIQNSGNLYFYNNLIDSKGYDFGVNEWGRKKNQSIENGEIVFVNNTLLSKPGKPALALERSIDTNYYNNETFLPNTYVSYNNIIDAGGGTDITDRGNNLYTSLLWNQTSAYGWSLVNNEFIFEDRDSIFVAQSLDNYNLLDYSPAVNAGTSVLTYLPTAKFPDYDFTLDIDGNQRPTAQPWSIGAYEYVHTTVSISEEKENAFVKCYPNPVINHVMIDYRGELSVRLMNMNGQLLLETKQHSLDMSELPSGIYFVQISLDSGKSLTQKLLKM